MSGDSSSLVSTCENPTTDQDRFSGANASDQESAESSNDWNRQQRRTFQRTSSLLHYWESHGYEILWLAFTSSPESRAADQLAYSHQRIRQRVERARLAYCDGDHCPQHDEPTGHFLGHIESLEHLQIRTSEGPQGVIHAFWAWDPKRFRDGNHSRSLFVPQSWLAEHWKQIHGVEVADLDRVDRPVAPGQRTLDTRPGPSIVWVSRYGDEATDGNHRHENVASYAASHYLGEHGGSLEHLSWSHGRSLGGPLAETWRAVVSFHDDIEEAIAVWKQVLAGESVAVSNRPGHGVHYSLVVKPPPDLGAIEELEGVVPPEDYVPRSERGAVESESFTESRTQPLDEPELGPCNDCSRWVRRDTLIYWQKDEKGEWHFVDQNRVSNIGVTETYAVCPECRE